MKEIWTTRTAEQALEIVQLLNQAGGHAFFVGGCVRDALLGHSAKDIDIEVYGLPLENVTAALSGHVDFSPVGVSFGVLKVHHADIDIALPRTENKTGSGHRGFLVSPNPSLDYRTAASRRDFTLNAILYDPVSDSCIDPLHGMEDLRNGILRHCSSHFSEDPLRVLRAMQFISRFGFSIAPETTKLCASLSQQDLAAERLAGEWEKMLLKGTYIARGLQFLRDCGWIAFYPELQALIGCRQNPKWHPEGDVWNHTIQAMEAVPPLRTGKRLDDLTLALAVLCHDFGKPATSYEKENGDITSPGHPVAGLDPAKTFLQRMWNENDLLEQILQLVQFHMEPLSFVRQAASDKAYRRLALRVQRMDILRNVAQCDMLGTGYSRPEDLAALDAFQRRAQELSLEHAPPTPILQGRHLLSMGFSPGPLMGKLLHEAFEAQLDGQFSSLEEGILWATRHFSHLK